MKSQFEVELTFQSVRPESGAVAGELPQGPRVCPSNNETDDESVRPEAMLSALASRLCLETTRKFLRFELRRGSLFFQGSARAQFFSNAATARPKGDKACWTKWARRLG